VDFVADLGALLGRLRFLPPTTDPHWEQSVFKQTLIAAASLRTGRPAPGKAGASP
jgi:hypothetical protein